MKKYYTLRETATPNEIIDAIKRGTYNRYTGLRPERVLSFIEYTSHGQTIIHFEEDELESLNSFIARHKGLLFFDDDGNEYSFNELEHKITNQCYETIKKPRYKTA